MKLLITGGHMTPALAVIQKLPKDAQVVYVGRKYALEGDDALSLEYQTMNRLRIPFIPFQPGRLQRKFTKHTLSSLGRVPKGILEAFGILRKEKSDVVLSFGGHVAFPICFAAAMLKVPVVTHEQTLEVGGTNRLIAKFATKICVSWESSIQFFPRKKVVLTGNPLTLSAPSHQMQETLENRPKKYPLLTITGGSLGSHPINALIEPIIRKLLAKYVVFHQTGDAQEFGDFDKLTSICESLPYTFQERYILRKFVYPEDMEALYEASDVVVSRSGINTVLTLLVTNTPSLLIPLPFSQRQEQHKNALLVKDSGLGEVLVQEGLTSDELLSAIEDMMEKRTSYTNRTLDDMRSLHEHAAENIISVVYGTQNNALQKKT